MIQREYYGYAVFLEQVRHLNSLVPTTLKCVNKLDRKDSSSGYGNRLRHVDQNYIRLSQSR